VSARQSRIHALLLICAGLSACATYQVAPEDCPAGTQKLEGCPPAGAVVDAEIAELQRQRTWVKPSEVNIDTVEMGRDAKIPINSAQAKFIGSTDEGGLTSLAAKIWLIENAEHTVDVMYYIFADDLVGHAMLGALCDAVQRGVDVRIMVDSAGSLSFKKKHLKALESCAIDGAFIRNEDGEITVHKARVQAVIFNAVSNIFVNMNRRSHDKLLVVDGHFPQKSAVMTGGRNVSLAYYGILEDGSHNPGTYRDAEIFLRGGDASIEEEYSIGKVSEIYYSLLFLFKNNKRLKMTAMSDPRKAYADERQMFLDKLEALKALSRFQEFYDEMPRYVSEDFHLAEVRLMHELSNLTDKNVVANAVENASLNPNSIMANLHKVGDLSFDSFQIVSPYMFAALYKDKDGNVVQDGAQSALDWLQRNPDSTIELVTNSVLTSDNFFAQAVIDMDMVPRVLLTEEMQQQWLAKTAEGEFNPDLVESDAWAERTKFPRFKVYEIGRLDSRYFGGDVDYAKLHAKYIVTDDMGFVGTTNFDYRSRLYNNEMGFVFKSEALANDLRENTAYLQSLSYRWGSPEWLKMRKKLMELKGRKASTTRKQRGNYKFLKNTGLQWYF
jgi:phosphatidylserine/phosphatidylglycerophosphate/cardiolipin synthase-like enzyme